MAEEKNPRVAQIDRDIEKARERRAQTQAKIAAIDEQLAELAALRERELAAAAPPALPEPEPAPELPPEPPAPEG